MVPPSDPQATPRRRARPRRRLAAEIGELGDNVRALRAAIRTDDLLRLALEAPTARLSVVGHTRWASVGIISEPNCHPLNGEQLPAEANQPYTVAVLNGDVDNHADIKVAHSLRIPGPITTDAKVIPTLVSRAIGAGQDPVEAFRGTVAAFEGSVAIAAHTAADPDRMLLALRGSGQALYVGLADDAFVVASEPYGVVEETDTYLRLDGETPGNPENPGASRGQIVVLDAAGATIRVLTARGATTLVRRGTANAGMVAKLRAFDEPVYFHQVIASFGDHLPLRRFKDLPDALHFAATTPARLAGAVPPTL